MQKQERLDPGWAWTKKYNIGAGVKKGRGHHLHVWTGGLRQ